MDNENLLDLVNPAEEMHSPAIPTAAAAAGDMLTLSKTDLQKMIKDAVAQAMDSDEAEEPDEPVDTPLDEEVNTSDEVSQAIAYTVKTRLKQQMPIEVLKQKKELYATVPANMTFLKRTNVNAEIWGSVNTHSRTRDKRYAA